MAYTLESTAEKIEEVGMKIMTALNANYTFTCKFDAAYHRMFCQIVANKNQRYGFGMTVNGRGWDEEKYHIEMLSEILFFLNTKS